MSVFNLYLCLFLLKTSLIKTYNEARTISYSGKGGMDVGNGKCRYPAATLRKCRYPAASGRKCRYPAATWECAAIQLSGSESAAIQLLLCGSDKVPLRGSQRGHTVTLVSKISLESYLVTLQQFFHKHKMCIEQEFMPRKH